MWVAFAKHSHFFSKNISVYAIVIDQSFTDTLTKDIVSFEHLGPAVQMWGIKQLFFNDAAQIWENQ